MTGRRQVDKPPAIADKRCNPVDQDKVSQVVCSELRFKAVGCTAVRCRHHPRICDNHVEDSSLCQQLVGTGTYALQVGKIEFNQFEASAIGCGVLSDLFS